MSYVLEHRTARKISDGEPGILGASLHPEGVNFALFSKYASGVFLLLFDDEKGDPTDIIEVRNKTDDVWHVFVHGIGAGQLYGYRVRGDYDPRNAKRFNEHKLLLDPYAKAITGKCRNVDNLLLAYDAGAADRDLSIDTRDSTGVMPKSIVVDDTFDWQGIGKPEIPVDRLMVYEVHAKGFTAHASSGVKHPGTYSGFVEKIPYLKELGINAVELMPVHEFHERGGLESKGLSEYWGYNTIGFFAPESSYCTGRGYGCGVREFKTLVRELHRAGIEVILDVVYNHTGEGNELGPTLCFKGIDNPTYYSLMGDASEPYRYYVNDTGCGNTFNIENPVVMRLVLDSLRYWHEVMQVDGFRFDLASILARAGMAFSSRSPFLEHVASDPRLRNAKLIAEPWDLTTYQVGNFPIGWSEWNGRFRDTVRRFVKGDPGQVGELASRVSGSSDLYGDDGRSPFNSVNYVTSHDGFTLRDLYSYNGKHNDANLDGNRDGTDDNMSWNCGIEGETDNPDVLRLRKQLMRNAICCVFFSLGTPMLLYGDEVMRTQNGNNNAYCQDNGISWFDWRDVERNAGMLDFCRKAIAFRRRFTILERRKFLLGKDTDNDNVPDVAWFGIHLDGPDWGNPESRLLCYQVDGSEEPSPEGDYNLFFIMNSSPEEKSIELPQHEGMEWHLAVDTSMEDGNKFSAPGEEECLADQLRYQAQARSVVALLNR